MRLTRFEGATIFTWTILKDEPTPLYRQGDWNTLKIRHEKNLIKCYVNSKFLYEVKEDRLPNGRYGLAKFRDTEAEYRDFRAGKNLKNLLPSPALLAKLDKAIAELEPTNNPDTKTIDTLKPNAALNRELLLKRAKAMDSQADQLRRLADLIHERSVQDALMTEFKKEDAKVNLLYCALLLSKLDNVELNPAHYQNVVDEMATEIRTDLPKDANATRRLTALGNYMFRENGYHGSRGDYYNRANSYINEVIDDREGIPITLSVLYMELARQLDLKVVGIGLPGHFVVAQMEEDREPLLIDVFENAKLLKRKDAEKIVRNFGGVPLQNEHLEPVDNRAIIVRMLRNLIGISNNNETPQVVLRYLNTLILLQPDSPQEYLNRALMHMRLKQNEKAKADVLWLLEKDSPRLDRNRLMELYRRL
jgi:regulator of sirC expression with transglutaminase-like and TPR domain